MNLKIFKMLDFIRSKKKGKNKESYSKKDLKYLVVIDENKKNVKKVFKTQVSNNSIDKKRRN